MGRCLRLLAMVAMLYTKCISGESGGLSCPNLNAYDVASSLLHIQFTQAAANGFNGISVKYNEPLDATVCRIWSVRLIMVNYCVSAGKCKFGRR